MHPCSAFLILNRNNQSEIFESEGCIRTVTAENLNVEKGAKYNNQIHSSLNLPEGVETVCFCYYL